MISEIGFGSDGKLATFFIVIKCRVETVWDLTKCQRAIDLSVK